MLQRHVERRCSDGNELRRTGNTRNSGTAVPSNATCCYQLEGYVMADELVRVSVAEAAKLLGVSSQTVRRRIEAGELKAETEPGGRGRGWRWMLLLPGTPEAAQQAHRADGGTPDLRLLAELRARVASLELHLEQSERAASETRQLLATAQALVEASTARAVAIEERFRIAESAASSVPPSLLAVAGSGATTQRRWWRPW